MKKILCILFFIPIVSFGQSSLGIKAGVSFSNWYVYNQGYTVEIGPNIGLIYSKLINNFQLTVEPSFNQKRMEYLNKYRTSLNYIELPITAGWVPFTDKIISGYKIIFGVNGGISPTWALSAKEKSASGIYNYTNLQRPNLDLIIGTKLGVKINDKTHLIFNLRYGHQAFAFHKNGGSEYYYVTPFFELGHRL